jgi:NAD(P)-dependent dehydrogenase (short-subunit alcohol dehydrogenase family)
MGLLDDKVVIITGAASSGGIGAACARRYAAEGGRVVIADIELDPARLVAREIADSGGEAIALPVDISDESAVVAMIRDGVDHYGRVDVVHNNAGHFQGDFLHRDTAIADLDLAVFDKAIAVDLRGYVAVTKHALPHLIRAGGGSIVNTSSVASTFGGLNHSAYGMAKTAVNALTMYVATQYGRFGVRCNALVLGQVETARALEVTDDAYRAGTERHILRGSRAKPEEIANAALFLASDESSYVNGHLLRVDGGYAAHMPRYADFIQAMQEAGD